MNLKLSTVFLVFVWCIFMGITVGSIGIGAVLPSANLIAKPFVCPGGSMQNESQTYVVSPVETVTTLTWYCVDEKTGAKTELGLFPMSLYAGTIYGLLFFLVVLIGMLIIAYRRAAQRSGRSGWNPTADAAFDEAMGTIDTGESAQTRQEKIEELTEKVRELQSELNKLKKRG